MGLIYKITNLIDPKIYVGQTRSSELIRWAAHKGNANKGVNNYLYNAMRKYGIVNFSIEVLESGIATEDLNVKEIEWIARLDSANPQKGYNATFGGYGGFHGPLSRTRLKGVRKHSAEVRAKISAALKGKPLTEAQLDARRRAGRARVGSHVSEETKRKSGEKISASWTPERRAAFAEIAKERFKPFCHLPRTEAMKEKMRTRVVSETTREKLRNKVVSEETRAKLSEAARRRNAAKTQEERTALARRAAMVLANKTRGQKRPPEVCAKIGAAHKGRKISPEQVEAHRQKLLGRKQSPEAIARRVESNRRTWAAKSESERLEHGRKTIALRSPRSPEHTAALIAYSRARVISEETRAKMSAAAKARGARERAAKEGRVA